MDIKKIQANSKEDAGSEVYRLLSMTHSMAGTIANLQQKEGVGIKPGFKLKSCATYDDYKLTVWTNDIVDISAETIDGINYYSLEAC